MDGSFTLKTGGSNEGKILTFAISGCSELMTIPFRTRAGRVSLYDLIRFIRFRTSQILKIIQQFQNNPIFLTILIKSIS